MSNVSESAITIAASTTSAIPTKDETFDDYEFESSSISPKRRSVRETMLERDLYLSSTVESSVTEEALQLSKEPSTSGIVHRNISKTVLSNVGDPSLVVESSKRTSSFNISSEVTAKVSKMVHMKAPRDLDGCFLSRSGKGPLNVSSQPPHFMDCVTSSPIEPSDTRDVGASLKILSEIQRLLIPQLQRDQEYRLYRDSGYMHIFRQEVLQAVKSCNGKFIREYTVLKEKVALLQDFIQQLNLALESMQKERRCVEEKVANFRNFAKRILQLFPSKYHFPTFLDNLKFSQSFLHN